MRLLFLPKNNIVGKINLNKLGYVRPDDSIKFANKNIANQYAKNVVVKALNKPQPMESGVLINASVIVKKFESFNHPIRINNSKLKFDTIVHGHSDKLGEGVAVGITSDDVSDLYKSFHNGAQRTIVYNSKGEFSKLERLPIVAPSIIPPNGIESYRNNKHSIQTEIMRHLIENIMDSQYALLKDLRQNGKVGEFTKEFIGKDWVSKLLSKISLHCHHNIIKNKAHEIGAKYSTNFSNLKDL